MISISYNHSPKLKDYLFRIEKLRRIILLSPINQKTKLFLRWNATFERIMAYAFLSKITLDKSVIAKLLSREPQKIQSQKHQFILKYKTGIDYIRQNWLGSTQSISSNDIIKIHQIVSIGKLSAPKEEIEYLLEYIQRSNENPIVQSAIIYIELLKTNAFIKDNEVTAALSSLLILYRQGYDFRGFISHESQWRENPSLYYENIKMSQQARSLTLWLEYFAQTIIQSLENVIQNINKPNLSIPLPDTFWELNDRQKSILSLLDKPEISLTNKKVQSHFKVSQITASRDLARLTNLGLLFSHGKGRSVYYTRV